jgi:hypothetical protein
MAVLGEKPMAIDTAIAYGLHEQLTVEQATKTNLLQEPWVVSPSGEGWAEAAE